LGINPFTNWVITDFGLDILEILCDFADLGGKTGKCPGKHPKGIYLKLFMLSLI